MPLPERLRSPTGLPPNFLLQCLVIASELPRGCLQSRLVIASSSPPPDLITGRACLKARRVLADIP